MMFRVHKEEFQQRRRRSNMRGVPAEEDIGKHNEQFQQRKVLGTERGTEEDI